jgi:hypothetical protein
MYSAPHHARSPRLSLTESHGKDPIPSALFTPRTSVRVLCYANLLGLLGLLWRGPSKRTRLCVSLVHFGRAGGPRAAHGETPTVRHLPCAPCYKGWHDPSLQPPRARNSKKEVVLGRRQAQQLCAPRRRSDMFIFFYNGSPFWSVAMLAAGPLLTALCRLLNRLLTPTGTGCLPPTGFCTSPTSVASPLSLALSPAVPSTLTWCCCAHQRRLLHRHRRAGPRCAPVSLSPSTHRNLRPACLKQRGGGVCAQGWRGWVHDVREQWAEVRRLQEARGSAGAARATQTPHAQQRVSICESILFRRLLTHVKAELKAKAKGKGAWQGGHLCLATLCLLRCIRRLLEAEMLM